VIRKILLGAIALVGLLASPALAQYSIIVTPGQVPPGGSVTATGEGCPPGSVVTITVTRATSTQAPGEVIFTETTTADADGEFASTFVMPADAEPGDYLVAAFCGGQQVASAIITVLGPTDGGGSAGTGVDDDDIVRTGSDLNGLGIAGAGLLTAGGLLLLATKGRRRQPTD